MTISDERFELNMQGLEADGLPGTAAELRARDAAQREALARVEAERDAERARGDAAVGDANEAEAQLAEAVGLLRYSQEIARLFDDEHTAEVGRFLARHAQAEQQEAQEAQAGEFQREDRYIVVKRKDLEAASVAERDWFKGALSRLEPHLPNREYLVIESDWPEYEPTWAAIQARVEARAALATQPATGEPKWSCLNAWFLSLEAGRQAVLREDKWMLAGAAFDAGRQCSAPPAAAHGDEAVRKMVLPERIDRRQYLGGRGDAVAQGWNDCLNWIDKSNAMRAQGDGEVQ